MVRWTSGPSEFSAWPGLSMYTAPHDNVVSCHSVDPLSLSSRLSMSPSPSPFTHSTKLHQQCHDVIAVRSLVHLKFYRIRELAVRPHSQTSVPQVRLSRQQNQQIMALWQALHLSRVPAQMIFQQRIMEDIQRKTKQYNYNLQARGNQLNLN